MQQCNDNTRSCIKEQKDISPANWIQNLRQKLIITYLLT